MDVRLDFELHLEKEAIGFLEEQINSFNIKKTGIKFGGFITSLVRNDANDICAGIHGWVWGNCCEIEYLWVHESLRGQGYGSRLLKLAEDEAKKRGCNLITLSTHSFQAPKFYQKKGFEFVGVVENYPAPFHKYYLRKQLI